MKYGRFIYRYTGEYRTGAEASYNIGDNIQTFAIDHLYEECQISSSDIIDLNYTEIGEYDGDYVIVPMAGYLSSYKEFHQFPLSPKIIPFFISSEFAYTDCKEIAPLLKRWEPVGARDEASLLHLREAGVEAYLSGCLTMTFPRRKAEPKKGKVFLVDISEDARKMIPDEYIRNSEELHHTGRVHYSPMDEEERQRIDAIARSTLRKYKEEASLVITSRLHAASPCIAMGIPTIVMCDNVDRRFAWLDKIIPLHDKLNYDKIDWNPDAADIEDVKREMIKLFQSGIKRLTDQYDHICKVSSFWESRDRFCYDGFLLQQLEEINDRFKEGEKFRYVIWGGGAHGHRAYELMKKRFPNATLSAVVDKYLIGELFGAKIVKGEELEREDFDYVIVSTSPGRFEAKQRLKDLGCSYKTDYCYFISQPKQLLSATPGG